MTKVKGVIAIDPGVLSTTIVRFEDGAPVYTNQLLLMEDIVPEILWLHEDEDVIVIDCTDPGGIGERVREGLEESEKNLKIYPIVNSALLYRGGNIMNTLKLLFAYQLILRPKVHFYVPPFQFEEQRKKVKEEVKEAIHQGAPVKFDSYPDLDIVRKILHEIAGEYIDAKDEIRAILALKEVKRLDGVM